MTEGFPPQTFGGQISTSRSVHEILPGPEARQAFRRSWVLWTRAYVLTLRDYQILHLPYFLLFSIPFLDDGLKSLCCSPGTRWFPWSGSCPQVRHGSTPAHTHTLKSRGALEARFVLEVPGNLTSAPCPRSWSGKFFEDRSLHMPPPCYQ